MIAKLKKDAWEKLSAEMKAEYVLKGEEYILKVDPVDGLALEDVSGLRSALEAERGEKKGLSDKLKLLGNIDPASVLTQLAELETLRTQAGDKDKTLAARLKSQEDQLVSKYDAELKSKTDRINMLTNQVGKILVESTVSNILLKPEFNGSPELLMPIIRERVKVVENADGTFATQVIDPKTGNQRLSRKTGNHGPMDVVELVEELKNDSTIGRAFAAAGKSGMGSGGNGKTGSSGTGGAFTISSAEAKDPARYRAVKAEAEKAGQQIQVTD